MLVMGIRMTGIRMSVVVPENRTILGALDTGVVSVVDRPDHDSPLSILDRERLAHIDEQTMQTSEPTPDDEHRRVIPELELQPVFDDEPARLQQVHVTCVDMEVALERIPAVGVAPPSAARHELAGCTR